VSFGRDELGRLTRIANVARGIGYPGATGTPDAHEFAAFTCAGRQRDTSLYSNDASVRYAHDGAGRIVEITHESQGSAHGRAHRRS
jgi:YD repeat-containing protein